MLKMLYQLITCKNIAQYFKASTLMLVFTWITWTA